jgi:hypothetical protein
MVDFNAVDLYLRMIGEAWPCRLRQSSNTMIVPDPVSGVGSCPEPPPTVAVELEFRELHIE